MSGNTSPVLGPYIEADVKITEHYYKVADLIPRFYEINPDTENVITGEELQNGMRVLTESYNQRAAIHPEMDEDQLERARRNNRWCEVTGLRIHGRNVVFIGVYDDGTKRRRTMDVTEAWIVKLDSIPDHENYEEVRLMVWEAMQFELPADGVAEETAREICRLFDKK